MRALNRFFQRWQYEIACLAAFLVPLKLSLAFIPLIPLILWWLLCAESRSKIWHSNIWTLSAPLVFFILLAVVSLPFNIAPTHSLRHMGTFLFFALISFVYWSIAEKQHTIFLLLALISGQTIAGLNSVLSHAFPESVPDLFIGTVSESGQLSLTILAALGLALFSSEKESHSALGSSRLALLWGFLNFTMLSALAFHRQLLGSQLEVVAMAVGGVLSLALGLRRALPLRPKCNLKFSALSFLLATVVLPILVAALVANLKRGPWLGVLIGSAALLMFYRRKFVAPLIILAVTLLALVTPVRERLFASMDDFFIAGGRAIIWEIGSEMIVQYPLGIGLENSGVLRSFAEEIPPNLKHFHSNFLNVLVETGWLGLGIFLWWLAVILRTAIRARGQTKSGILAIAIGCAILSWQSAGVVEYNFGDSEVRFVALILIGILASLADNELGTPNQTETRPATA